MDLEEWRTKRTVEDINGCWVWKTKLKEVTPSYYLTIQGTGEKINSSALRAAYYLKYKYLLPTCMTITSGVACTPGCVNVDHAVLRGLPGYLLKESSVEDHIKILRVFSDLNPKGCWVWGGVIRGDYGAVVYNGKNSSVHRLAYSLYTNDWKLGRNEYICHSCDTPLCCNPTHLFKGTPKENTQDMWIKGRQGNRSKLTDGEVFAIRKLYKLGVSNSTIMEIFSVAKGYAYKLEKGVIRNDVPRVLGTSVCDILKEKLH